jgi:hypothetical protein
MIWRAGLGRLIRRGRRAEGGWRSPSVWCGYFQRFLEEFRAGWNKGDRESGWVYDVLCLLRGPDLPSDHHDVLVSLVKDVFCMRVRGFVLGRVEWVEGELRAHSTDELMLARFLADWDEVAGDETLRRGLAHFLDHARRAHKALALLAEDRGLADRHEALADVAHLLMRALEERWWGRAVMAVALAIERGLANPTSVGFWLRTYSEAAEEETARLWRSLYGGDPPWRAGKTS